MKTKNIIAMAAVGVAAVAGFLIRKKNLTRQRKNSQPQQGAGDRHVTNVFSKAKSSASGPSSAPGL